MFPPSNESETSTYERSICTRPSSHSKPNSYSQVALEDKYSNYKPSFSSSIAQFNTKNLNLSN